MDLIFRALMTEVCPPDPEGITWPVNHPTHDPHDLNCFMPLAVLSIMLYCLCLSVLKPIVLYFKYYQPSMKKTGKLLASMLKIEFDENNTKFLGKKKTRIHSVIFNIRSSNIFGGSLESP